jgi:hypothetical protein
MGTKRSSPARSARRDIGICTLAISSALALVAVPARAEGETGTGPCDALVGYLRGALAGPVPEPVVDRGFDYRERERNLEGTLTSTGRTQPRAYTALITPACRTETRRGAAPAAVAAARAWTQRREPGWIDRGRILLCTMQDPSSLGGVATWMAESGHAEVRAVCVSEIATWPGAESVRDQILGRAVRQPAGSWPVRWEIDPAVVAAANVMGTPELYDELLPVLAAAHAHQALGYDRLEEAVCAGGGTMSEDRARTCSTPPADAEDEWRQRRQTSRLLTTGVATAVFAGAVTGAFVERHDETGRLIATGAGVPLGALIGITTFGVALGPVIGRHTKTGSHSAGDKVLAATVLIGGTVVGGLFGGWAARALTASPGARAPVTAIALAPIYLTTVFVLNLD